MLSCVEHQKSSITSGPGIREKFHSYCSHSREGKTLSHSRIYMVMLSRLVNPKAMPASDI